MTTPQLDKSLCDLLVAAFITGTSIEATRDALAVVRVLRQLRPLAPQLAAAEALQLLHDGDHRTARLVLEEADALSPRNAFVKAVLALALVGQGDSLWQAYVDEVKALPPDDKALAIVASVEKAARNDPADLDPAGASPLEPAAGSSATYLPYLQMGLAC